MRFQKVLTSLTRVGCYQHSSLYNRLTVTVITALVTGPPATCEFCIDKSLRESYFAIRISDNEAV